MFRTLRGVSLAVALLSSSSSLFAQLQPIANSDGTTVRDMVRQLRDFRETRRAAGTGRVKGEIVSVDWTKESFIIPVAGNVQGSNGTFFKSDVTLANRRSTPQVIAVGFLQRGVNNGNNPVQYFTIPANTTDMERDFVGNVLQKSAALGTILVIAKTAAGSAGQVDTNGAIDGFSRIWTPQPVLAGQSSSAGSVSQSFEAIDLQDNLAESWGYGLRQDANFRTNVGLVNLFDTSNTFTINVVGLQGSTTFQTTVQPFSMEQPALPAGVYGDLFIHVTSASSNFNWWSAYGSSVDNATGDGWVSHVH
jgi:hypothetical protein